MKSRSVRKHGRQLIALLIASLTSSTISYGFIDRASASTVSAKVMEDSSTLSSSPNTVQDPKDTSLHIDGVPRRRAYIKFSVSGVNGTASSAKLGLYASTRTSAGYDVYAVSSSWSAGTLTFANQPTLGRKLGTVGAFGRHTATSVSLPNFVTGNGTYSVAVVALDGRHVRFQSMEATNKPSLAITYSATTAPSTSLSGPVRAAFYYPWFRQAWNQQGYNPFTNYHPSLGYYSSANLTTVQRHVAAMQYAHLDAGILSWWGRGDYTDSNSAVAFEAAAGTGFKWAFYYEKESTGNPTVEQISSDLAYLKSKYTGNTTYLESNGKPVIFVFADDNDRCGMADRWVQAGNSEGFAVDLKVFPGYLNCSSQPAGWHQYAPAMAADSQAGKSFAISPGFYKKGESAPRLTRDLTRWTDNIKSMIASNAPWQLVTTFNEWGEGTSVESAEEWASSGPYGAYIEALHNNIPARTNTSSTT